MKLDGLTYAADPLYLVLQGVPVVVAVLTVSSAETVHILAAPVEKVNLQYSDCSTSTNFLDCLR